MKHDLNSLRRAWVNDRFAEEYNELCKELQQLQQKYDIKGKTTIREPSQGLIHTKDGTYIRIDEILGETHIIIFDEAYKTPKEFLNFRKRRGENQT